MLVCVNRLGESKVGALGAGGGVDEDPSLGALGGEEVGGTGESRSVGELGIKAGEVERAEVDTGGPRVKGALRVRGERDKGEMV